MKYLYLIIRHFFPRKRWQCVQVIDVKMSEADELPLYYKYVLQDQFGNIKKVKI